MAHVAVVIDENLQQHHRVLAELVKDLKDQVLVMVASVARGQQLEEDSLDEDKDDAFEILAEVGEEMEEDGCDERKDFSLVRHAISQQSIAQMVLDYVSELFSLQETGLGLLKNGQDKFQADYLGPDHVITQLFLSILLFVALDAQLDDAAEDKNRVLKSRLSVFRESEVGPCCTLLGGVKGRAFDNVFLLTLIGADGVLRLRAEDVRCVTTHDTPAVVSSGQANLVDDVD